MDNLPFESVSLDTLCREPGAPVRGNLGKHGFTARICISNYTENVKRRYGVEATRSVVPIEFPHFGSVFEFDQAVEIPVFDENRVLDQGLRKIVEALGPVILRNAHMPARHRLEGQRNIFSSLKFHVDRGSTQEDCYSLFWRDPFDEFHKMPRTSSTLIVTNAAAFLQARKEGDPSASFKPLYQLFEKENMSEMIGDVVLEQPWRAPAGTGEITILDNRTVLHASYYARPENRGYPIGVCYLY